MCALDGESHKDPRSNIYAVRFGKFVTYNTPSQSDCAGEYHSDLFSIVGGGTGAPLGVVQSNASTLPGKLSGWLLRSAAKVLVLT